MTVAICRWSIVKAVDGTRKLTRHSLYRKQIEHSSRSHVDNVTSILHSAKSVVGLREPEEDHIFVGINVLRLRKVSFTKVCLLSTFIH